MQSPIRRPIRWCDQLNKTWEDLKKEQDAKKTSPGDTGITSELVSMEGKSTKEGDDA